MSRFLGMAALVACVVGCSVPRDYAFEKEAKPNRTVDEPLPEPQREHELVSYTGDRVKLSDFKGQRVLLIFNRGYVGYVCPYCTTYSAQIATRYEEFKGKGTEVLLVYPTEAENPDEVKEFVLSCEQILKEEGMEGLGVPVLLDPGLAAVKTFNVTGDLSKPSTFLLDEQGIVRYAYVGDDKRDRPSVDRLLQEVDALSAGAEPPR